MVKHGDIFLKAFFIAFVIFSGLLVIALFFEINRLNLAYEKYSVTDLSWQDLRIKEYYYGSLDNLSCNDAIKSNKEFADRIYKEGLIIQSYEDANRLTGTVINEKKKYVLLQLEFWYNLETVKERCFGNYTTIAYFYSQYPTLDQKATQNTISDLLVQLKRENPDRLMLIPISSDIGLSSVDFVKSLYNVTYLPSLIINKKIKLQGLYTIEEIREKAGLAE